MNAKLEEKIDRIKEMSIKELCEKFDCKPEEICMGDYMPKYTGETVCPYKVILGYANFEGSNVTDLGKLEVVYGRKQVEEKSIFRTKKKEASYLGISVKYSKIQSLGRLRKVYGSIGLNSSITTLGNLEFLGSSLYISNLNVQDLGKLKTIDGILYLEDDSNRCKVMSLGKLKRVGKLCLNTSTLRELGDLEEFSAIQCGTKCNYKIGDILKDKFKKVDGKYVRKDLIQSNETVENQEEQVDNPQGIGAQE